MATATEKKSETNAKVKTKYMVLTRQGSEPKGQWTEQEGTFEGYTPKQGIASWAKTWEENEPEYAEVVAVPVRQFVPRQVSVNNRVTVSFT